ncbi:MAG: hypothetical protein P8X68_16270 [Desulfobacterales bacterium]
MEFLGSQQWLLIAVIFFGIIGYIALMRWRDRKWIEERFGSRPVLAMSFGVNFFGKTYWRYHQPGSHVSIMTAFTKVLICVNL